MRSKTYNIDINNKIYTLLEYKQYDNNIPITFNVSNDSTNMDLSGYTVGAFFCRRDGEIFEKNTTISESTVTTMIDNNITALDGTVQLELVFIKRDKSVTSFTIYLDLEKSIEQENAELIDSQWDTTKDLLTVKSKRLSAENIILEDKNNNFISDNVEDGLIELNEQIQIFENVPTLESKTYTPTTSNQIIQSGRYLKGNQTILGDVNLVSSNIPRGRRTGNYLFGVRGSADIVSDIDYGYVPWCGSYANEAVKVARSYWDARIQGKVSYSYSGGNALFDGKLTNAQGRCLCDCSSYILLVLYGLDFNHSPFHQTTGNLNLSIDLSTIIPSEQYEWVQEGLTKPQLTKYFPNGKIRYAADLAEYFYLQGRVVPLTKIMPGDLIFHAAKYEDGTYHINNRFKNISHVSIVAEEYYIQRDENKNVVYYEYYNCTDGDKVIIRTRSTSRNDVVFAVRPNYIKQEDLSETMDINLLPSIYNDGDLGTVEKNNITFTIDDEGNIITEGVTSAKTTFHLTDKTHPIYLKKGNYRLSGCPARVDVTSGKTWGVAIKTTDTNVQLAWDLGQGAEFKIENDFESIYVYIYISSGKSTTGYIFKPKLIRIS